jgi:hypothetical protein
MPAIETIAIEAAAEIEHISMGGEDDTEPMPRAGAGSVGATLRVADELRGCVTSLTLLDDRYLKVRLERGRTPRREYLVDLRFLDPTPVRGRTISWRLIKGAAGAAGASLVVALATLVLGTRVPAGALSGVSILLATLAVCGLLLGLYRSRETVSFLSVHGRAPLVRIEGGFGCARTIIEFAPRVAATVKDLRSRERSMAEFLRDEMREHFRLREEKALSQQDYERSRVRILRAHG